MTGENLKREELEKGVGRLLSGYFECDRDLHEHIAYAIYLSSEAMCAKFGRRDTIYLLKALINNYTDDQAEPCAEWETIKQPSLKEVH